MTDRQSDLSWLSDVNRWAEGAVLRMPDGRLVNTETGEIEDPEAVAAAEAEMARARLRVDLMVEWERFCRQWAAAHLRLPPDRRVWLKGTAAHTGYPEHPVEEPWATLLAAVETAWRAAAPAEHAAALMALRAEAEARGMEMTDESEPLPER